MPYQAESPYYLLLASIMAIVGTVVCASDSVEPFFAANLLDESLNGRALDFGGLVSVFGCCCISGVCVHGSYS